MVSGLFWLLLELASVTKMPQSMWESLSAKLNSSPVSQRHPLIVNECSVCNSNGKSLPDYLNCFPDTTQSCRLSGASAGTYPVMVSFPSLGKARFAGGNMLYFTYQLIVSSISPVSGSVAG